MVPSRPSPQIYIHNSVKLCHFQSYQQPFEGTEPLPFFIGTFLVACGGDGSSTGANGGSGNDSGNSGGSEFDASSNTLKDSCDSKAYKTVKIGDQVWMAENLDYETANSICGEMEYLTLYGSLYSWEEAKTVCPDGWHLPNQAEWNTLIEFVGDSATAGKFLKATNTWSDKGHYKDGTDDFGFTALPGDVRLPQKARRISHSSIREPFSGVPPRSMPTSQSPWFCVTKTMPRHCSKTTRTPALVSGV